MFRYIGWSIFLLGVAVFVAGGERDPMSWGGRIGIGLMMLGALVTCAATLSDQISQITRRKAEIRRLQEERRRPGDKEPRS